MKAERRSQSLPLKLLLLFSGSMAALFVSRGQVWQSSRAVLVGLQEMATGRKSTVKAGGEASDVCGDVGENTRCGLVVIGDLKQRTSGQMWCSKPQHLATLLAGVRSELRALIHLANLGDSAGLFPDCEASTEHLSPGVVLSGRVGGQSDRTQSNQIWVPERDKRR